MIDFPISFCGVLVGANLRSGARADVPSPKYSTQGRGSVFTESQQPRRRASLGPVHALARPKEAAAAHGGKVRDTEEDVSGAIAWARECNHNGEMRSWIELDPAKYGCEGILWTASLILLRHLEVTQPAGWWRGRRVLEFGSGTGHMAVGLARLGAHVVATESAESHNGSLSSCYVNMVRFTTQLLQSRPGGGQEAGSAALWRRHWSTDDRRRRQQCQWRRQCRLPQAALGPRRHRAPQLGRL